MCGGAAVAGSEAHRVGSDLLAGEQEGAARAVQVAVPRTL
jgi:hypothetical protein